MTNQISRRSLLPLMALISAAVPYTGYAARRLPDFPAPPSEKQGTFGDSDLAFATYTMRDPIEQKQYFGLDLSRHDIIPLWIAVTNKSSRRYIIDPSTITISNRDQILNQMERDKTSINSDAAKTTQEVGAVVLAIGPALLISLPMLLISSNSLASASEIKRNLVSKQLYARTIAPEETVAGFIYPQIHKTSGVSAKFEVTIPTQPVPVLENAVKRNYRSELEL